MKKICKYDEDIVMIVVEFFILMEFIIAGFILAR
jgi:hypothetical protein